MARLVLILLLFPSACGAQWNPGRDSTAGRIAFISDTQAPIIIEELALRPDRNTEATRALLHDLLLKRPEHLFFLGDIVSLGFYGRTWETVDAYLDSLHARGTRTDAVPGNHELMLFPGEGIRNFRERFPGTSLVGEERTVDSVAVILLNSNLDHLTATEAAAQRTWYSRTLDSLDQDPAVRAIIVCCHHSPYSLSTVVGSALEVRAEFVPPFINTHKARLFLSGHAHTFEHFRIRQKDFLVIGGGGGLIHPLADSTRTGLVDIAPFPRPRHHYLLVRRRGDRLDVTVRALRSDFSGLDSIPCPLDGSE